MNSTSRELLAPAMSAWCQVEEAVEAFENAYREAGSAELSQFAPPPDNPLYLPIARELLRADLEFAWSEGRPKRIDDYRDRFPRVFADPESLRAIAFEEYRLRAETGEAVTPGEYVERFGVTTAGWNADDRASGTHATSVFAPAIVRALFEEGSNGGADGDLAADLFAHPDRFPEPGDVFLGFKLVRELGRGAFARVFLAEQTEMAGRLVALKVSAQMQRESQTLARLQHTNIVPIYSTHTRGRFTGICMPYFGATTLADVLQRIHKRDALPASAEGILSTVAERKASATVLTASEAPGIPTEEPPAQPTPHTAVSPLDNFRHLTHAEAVLWIGAELAEGLAFSHDRGIVHRDLKPANVLIADDGRPMILDFNLAVTAGDERFEHAGGTPSHMAPEQLAALMGDQTVVDARSDIYSLGLVLYELLAGRLPGAASEGTFKDRVKRLRADRSQPPPPAARANPAVSPAVDAILAKCLAPNSAQRYSSAHQLSADIRRHLNHQPLLHVREPSVRERFRKTLRRNPWMKSFPFLAAVVLLAVGTTTAALMTASHQRERTDAVERFQSYGPKAVVARNRLSVPDPDPVRLERDVAEARVTLATYGLPDATDWSRTPAIQRLDAESQTRLRANATDLLVFLAHAEVMLVAQSANVEARQSRIAEALRLNALAGDAAPDDHRRWVATRQRAALYERADRRDEAKAVRDALGSPPPGPYAAMYQFAEAYSRNDLREALAILRASEPTTSSRADIWYARGRTHAELGEYPVAVAAYTTALALQPDDNYRLLVHRGQAYLELRDYAAASRDFDAAIRLRSDEAANYVDRALARFRIKDHRGAVADLDRALELDPGHTRSYFVRRQVRLQMGDRDGAAKELEEGLTRTPEDEVSWIARGVHKLGQRDAKGAVADFDAALKLNPTSKRALQNKASALSEHLQKADEAIRVLDRLVEHHPDYINGRAGRGVLLARQGKRTAAHADATETLKRDSAAFTKYQVAGIYALTSKTNPEDQKEAFRLLAQAFKAGADSRLEKGDQDLDPVRSDPTFRKLVEAVRTLEGLAGR